MAGIRNEARGAAREPGGGTREPRPPNSQTSTYTRNAGYSRVVGHSGKSRAAIGDPHGPEHGLGVTSALLFGPIPPNGRLAGLTHR